MQRAVRVLPRGSFDETIDEVVLDYESRYRRRILLTGKAGTEFLLDLEEARVLQAGEGLALEAGGVIAVKAADEELMQVTAPDGLQLMRLAWHIGNRHLPAQIEAERILLRPDAVIARMIEGLGGKVTEVRLPFDPEGGAYAQKAGHDHGHHHD